MSIHSCKKLLVAGLFALITFVDAGCQEKPSEPQKNYVTGTVTLEGGAPITVPVEDYAISIHGVSESAGHTSYTPIVKKGAYKQKLAAGQYAFNPAKIKVKFGETVFTLPLEPVGNNWNKNQDSEEGIVQDFVWKPTGQRDTYGAKPDPNNATHWYGLNIGMRFQTWRSDTNKAPTVLPDGTTLVFTLKPTSKSIDGRDLQPITIERAFHPKATTMNDDLNDLPIATYELTGQAKLPDGTTRPILLQGHGMYPKYATMVPIVVEMDNILGKIAKQPIGWVTD